MSRRPVLTELPVSLPCAHEEEGTGSTLLMGGKREDWLEVPALEGELHSSPSVTEQGSWATVSSSVQ